ncbi:MAG: phosphoribosylglycinamide formyltransferase [Verrucomicrobia bacterium]|nr:phosphoribosylglycinamide formyltransferase [Verrucomicrobiota bacterium]
MEIKARLGILGSGKGSNMFALAEACRQGVIRAEIAQVVSDVENAGILDRAKDFDIPATYLSPGPFRTKLDEDAELNYIRLFREAKVDWIVLAGFMRILKGDFLKAFPNQVINIHPSLLPSFPGLEAWKQALEYGVKYTGCTVHFVDQGIDTGAIILQETVPVMDDDTPQSLHARIQDAEHHLYPAAVGLAVEGRLEVRGRLCSKAAI